MNKEPISNNKNKILDRIEKKIDQIRIDITYIGLSAGMAFTFALTLAALASYKTSNNILTLSH